MSGPSSLSHKLVWFKSSYSGGNATECVECAHAEDGIRIRDSKRGNEAVIAVQQQAWTDFLRSVSGSAAVSMSTVSA
jgi:hypothetical protein